MTLVLQAGLVECALADAQDPAVGVAAQLLDLSAAALVGDERRAARLDAAAGAVASALESGPPLCASTPEGFAFYALDPLAFAAAAEVVVGEVSRVLVIGIRTAGTTLSAVAAAALRRRGLVVSRTTVRPAGHPFDRVCVLDEKTRRELARAGSGSTFLVVDEGPGLSGSSFLATAEALVAAGAPASRVVLLGSREENGTGLCAPDGARRWRGFRSAAAPPAVGPPGVAARRLSGGSWRALWMGSRRRWPAVWPQAERMKLVADGDERWFKFEGFGGYGQSVWERQSILAGAGLVVAPLEFDAASGFISFPVVAGTPLHAAALDERLVRHMARYVAFRARALPAVPADVAALDAMARLDTAAEIGVEVPAGFRLEMTTSVIPDGRMQPHEWLRTASGTWMKTDAVDHGDDHFYPGPADAAWDLAGAIVEWRMTAPAQAALLEHYREASGDDASPRLASWLVAYAAAHASRAQVAAATTGDAIERRRLLGDARRYRAALRRAVDGLRGMYGYCTYLVGDHIPTLGSSGGRCA